MLFDKNWFIKHQDKLLFFLNTPLISLWFRWVLKIDGNKSSVGNKKIVKINPNSITWEFKRTKKKIYYSTEFRTHDKFSKRLYYAFKPFWYLLHFFDWIALDRVEYLTQFSFGFSTLTVYPAAGEVSPVDGDVARSGVNETLATIRAGAGTTVFDAVATGDNYIQASTTSNQYQALYRFIACFDTSPLTIGAVISAATLSMYGRTQIANLGQMNMSLVTSNPASTSILAASDFQTVGTTKQAADITYASWTTVGYNDWTLNATGLGNISKNGISKFASALSCDIDNAAPTWASNAVSEMGVYQADQVGTTQDPKLVVTYTTQGGSFLFNFI